MKRRDRILDAAIAVSDRRESALAADIAVADAAEKAGGSLAGILVAGVTARRRRVRRLAAH
jgi:hypothetical protein